MVAPAVSYLAGFLPSRTGGSTPPDMSQLKQHQRQRRVKPRIHITSKRSTIQEKRRHAVWIERKGVRCAPNPTRARLDEGLFLRKETGCVVVTVVPMALRAPAQADKQAQGAHETSPTIPKIANCVRAQTKKEQLTLHLTQRSTDDRAAEMGSIHL